MKYLTDFYEIGTTLPGGRSGPTGRENFTLQRVKSKRGRLTLGTGSDDLPFNHEMRFGPFLTGNAYFFTTGTTIDASSMTTLMK